MVSASPASVPPKPPAGEGSSRDLPSQAPPLLLGVGRVGGTAGEGWMEWAGP